MFALRRVRPRALPAAAAAVAASACYALSPSRADSRSGILREFEEAVLDSLPDRVILVRHGESEGNCDHHLYRTKADNLIELTDRGTDQALAVGCRIAKLLAPEEKVVIFVSPFERTLQTARNLKRAFAEKVDRTYVEPRIREQEFGNLQGDEFASFRRAQAAIGRFFYRFPTGESGCDVYDRAKTWWDDTLLRLNLRPGYHSAGTVVVVTHGLTMRLILMQLFSWSPTTFSTVWNADNCEMYVLRKDRSHAGFSPYVLDSVEGDAPRSSAPLVATFADGSRRTLELEDYLSLPQPRTAQQGPAIAALARQHGLEPADVVAVDFFAARVGYDVSVTPPPGKFR